MKLTKTEKTLNYLKLTIGIMIIISVMILMWTVSIILALTFVFTPVILFIQYVLPVIIETI